MRERCKIVFEPQSALNLPPVLANVDLSDFNCHTTKRMSRVIEAFSNSTLHNHKTIREGERLQDGHRARKACYKIIFHTPMHMLVQFVYNFQNAALIDEYYY